LKERPERHRKRAEQALDLHKAIALQLEARFAPDGLSGLLSLVDGLWPGIHEHLVVHLH